jgi:hypothetical protein
MSSYAGVSCERLVQVGMLTAPSRSDAQHFVLSPRTSRGLPTAGLALVLLKPSAGGAVATSPGFDVTIYRAIPVLGSWAALQTYSAANYGDQLTLPDLSGGMALFFSIQNGTAGNLILAIAEMD